MIKETYTQNVGTKFHADGSVRTFPGNTIICFVDPVQHAKTYQQCLWVQGEIRTQLYKHKFAFLPPSSFHMTVFELLCSQVRSPSNWSKLLPLDASLAEMDHFFISKVVPVPSPKNLQMKVTGLWNSCSLRLEPADQVAEAAIRAYRDEIARVTGVRFPNHTDYQFHISTMYQIQEMSSEEDAAHRLLYDQIDKKIEGEQNTFMMPQPQLTFFDDMYAFVTEERMSELKTRA